MIIMILLEGGKLGFALWGEEYALCGCAQLSKLSLYVAAKRNQNLHGCRIQAGRLSPKGSLDARH